MTEQEWLTCIDPLRMLEFMRGRATERQLRLFACGAFWRNWHLLETKKDRHVVRIAELYADRAIGGSKLADAFIRAGWGFGPTTPTYRSVNWCQQAIQVAFQTVEVLLANAHSNVTPAEYPRILHDIFGNFFRPVNREPSWGDPTVQRIAAGIYDERRFADLPVLADALEDAGCAAQELLDHCRQSSEHVRGCWTLDLILGKE